MLHISERPLTEAEQERLDEELALHNASWGSWLALFTARLLGKESGPQASIRVAKDKGIAQVISFDVKICWAVEYDEDIGDAFLLQTTEDDYVFVYPLDWLLTDSEANPEETNDANTLRKSVRVTVIPEIKRVLGFETWGPPLDIPVYFPDVEDGAIQNFAHYGAFGILGKEELPSFVTKPTDL